MHTCKQLPSFDSTNANNRQMKQTDRTLPRISMAGIEYQLMPEGDNIVIVTVDRSLVDDITHSDKIWEGGYAVIEENIRFNEPFATDEQVEELVNEIMAWHVRNHWMEVCEVTGSQHLNTK